MALCRGLNAGYGSVGLLEPRIYQVGENSPPLYRQRLFVLNPCIETGGFSKAASGGRAIGLRREQHHSFPHGSFISPLSPRRGKRLVTEEPFS